MKIKISIDKSIYENHYEKPNGNSIITKEEKDKARREYSLLMREYNNKCIVNGN
jgi:hypothetical protein